MQNSINIHNSGGIQIDSQYIYGLPICMPPLFSSYIWQQYDFLNIREKSTSQNALYPPFFHPFMAEKYNEPKQNDRTGASFYMSTRPLRPLI